MEGRTHVWPRRVYYADTDAAGVVYHANYLVYAEQARTECLRCLGLDFPPLGQPGGLAFAVGSVEMLFKRPAHLDDRLQILSSLLELGGASSVVRQVAVRVDPAGGRETLVEMVIKAIAIGADFRAMRLPQEVRTTLSERMLVAEREEDRD
jgi:acyl-CoA thioester hydrolase